MTRIHAVRHGLAAGSYTEHLDPGLAPRGLRQAEAVADRLETLGPIHIVSSPLARARQTASPLARRWGAEPTIVEAVTEIPSFGRPLSERETWLGSIMSGTWAEVDDEVIAWRDAYVDALVGLSVDTVVFSHFVGINAAIGAATADDRLQCRRLDHTSVTTFDIVDGSLMLADFDDEAPTEVR